MFIRNLVKFSILAQFFLVGCNSGTQQSSNTQPKDSVAVQSTENAELREKQVNLQIQKISVFNAKGKLQYTDQFCYNQQGQLVSTNSGATVISYGSQNNENFISVKTNGCTYTYRYNANGDLYLLNQVGPDWKMDLNLEVEGGKLKTVKAQEMGFSEKAVWKDGNMQSYSQFDEEESTTHVYTYGNLENKFGFDLIDYLAFSENRLPYMNVRFLAKEAISKNLPETITTNETTQGALPLNDKFNLRYQLDDFGRVITITVVGRKKYQISYAD